MTAALSSPSAGFPIRWLPLALALMLGGCPTGAPDSDDDDTTEDVEPFDPPDEPGPYAAATIEDIAPSREGLSLPVQLWFPALHPDDDLHVYDDLIEGAAADGGGPDCSESRP
ncbi:MAG: hypothetical protein QGH45_11860, partial [Myxococcota bacterium]|nr:hypothetical protein [Myxococcota bacterium]